MNIQQISQADLLDILFEGRNKLYGAYDLRKHYNNRLYKAIAGMIAVCLLLAAGYVLAGRFHKKEKTQLITEGIVRLTNAVTPEKKIAPVILPKPIHVAVAPTIRSITPVIVKDNLVKPEDVPPANEDITDNVKIGSTTIAGTGGEADVVAPPSSAGDGTGVTGPLVKKAEEEEGIFTTVQIESSYKGGPEAWKRFLLKNFRPPEMEADGPVTATVVVRFIVDKEGKVSEVEAISGPERLRQEAVRVIRLSGQWEPAIQNGRKVSAYKLQPITVTLQDQ
jgi:protein TonB